MPDRFTLAPLDRNRVLQAYPLVRETLADLTVDAWCEYATRLLRLSSGEEERGIIGISSDNKYLRGLFTYHIEPDVRYGRTLNVEYFVVESVFSPRTLAIALLSGVEALAQSKGCTAIHTHLRSAPEWLVEVLRERGYGSDAWQMCKTLRPDAVSAAS